MITYVILFIVGAAVAIGLSVLLINMSKPLRIIFQVVFFALMVVFGYFLVESVMKPIRFNKELDSREELAIQKLKDIRTIQVAYKSKYGKFTGSFDTLLSYVKTDSFEIVSEKFTAEWNQDEVTKEDAIKQGIIKVTKSYIPVTDSLTNDLLYDIDDIRFVPFTNRDTEIALAAGEIETASKVVVKVFEASIKYLDLLNGMDEQLVVNHIDNKYVKTNFEGLKVGSLVEATNNAGNWED